MKQEFLAVLIVLATTGALLLQNSFATGEPRQEQQEVESPRFANASARRDVDTDAASSSDSTRDLIQRSSEELRDSRPLQAKLRFRIDLFGESVSGPGMYFQAGQGTRKARLEFEFGFDEKAVSLRQFCDGNTLYNVTQSGAESSLEFVDLRKLDALQEQPTATPGYSLWLQAGSLSALMSQVSGHFEFEPHTTGTLDTIPVIFCQGTWRPDALKKLLDAQPGAAAFSDNRIDWDRLPQHIPHQVRLTLGTDERFPYFPYRIEFLQFARSDDPESARCVALLELYEVRHVANMPDELFRLPSMDCIPVDATDFYAERVRQFGR